MAYLYADMLVDDIVWDMIDPTDKSIQRIRRPKYSTAGLDLQGKYGIQYFRLTLS
jgi:hypothetical protein